MVECHSVTSDKKYMYIKFIQKRPFTFWKDVSMHNDGKLRNGKLSPCVCKRIKNEFYFCVLTRPPQNGTRPFRNGAVPGRFFAQPEFILERFQLEQGTSSH